MDAIKLVHTKNLSRDEWLEERKKLKGIGGSAVATALNLNENKTQLRLYLELRGEIEPKDISHLDAVKAGNYLEPAVAQWFSDETGFKVQNCNYILGHKTNKHMYANLDRIVTTPEGRGVLEIKTTNEFLRNDWNGENVPDAYMIQVQHYLAVTGYKFGYLAVLIGGQTFKYFYIPRDEAIIKMIESEVNNFMERVESGNRPPIDGTSDAKDLLNTLYPPTEIEKSAIHLEAEEWAERYEKRNIIAKQIKELKKEQDQIDNEFKEKIGNNNEAIITTLDGKTAGVTWNITKGFKVDYDRMIEDNIGIVRAYEDLKEKHTVSNPTRRINYKKAK